MLKLINENEKVLLIMRKHWFIMARVVFLFIILLLIPPVALTLLPLARQYFNLSMIESATNLFLSLYTMAILLLLFLIWMEYYLDMWIITNERIIDVEQKGLFSREISEIPLDHVQDITIEINGIIETFLHFGTIRVQTAGEREFLIDDVPHLYEAKDLILKHLSSNNI